MYSCHQFEELKPERDCALECGPDKTCFPDTCCGNAKKKDGTAGAGDSEIRQRATSATGIHNVAAIDTSITNLGSQSVSVPQDLNTRM
jgi:hypothetical protein